MRAFQKRVKGGMHLSSDVWNLDQFKKELELSLEMGLGRAKSLPYFMKDNPEYVSANTLGGKPSPAAVRPARTAQQTQLIQDNWDLNRLERNQYLIPNELTNFNRTGRKFSRKAVTFFCKAVKFSREAVTFYLSLLTSPLSLLIMDSLTGKHLTHVAHVAPGSNLAGLWRQEA